MNRLKLSLAAAIIFVTASAQAQDYYHRGAGPTHRYHAKRAGAPCCRSTYHPSSVPVHASQWPAPSSSFYGAPPESYCAPPVYDVPTLAPGPTPYRHPGPQPLIALRPTPPDTYVGRGSLGQPKAYVPGQPVRNFLRWLTP